MTKDWKDQLDSLRGLMPEVSEEPMPEPTGEVKKKGGKLRVVLDRKGRKGKTATISEGFEMDDDEIEPIAKMLKQKIGTGGSVRGGEILLQGDWRERAAGLLSAEGFDVKTI